MNLTIGFRYAEEEAPNLVVFTQKYLSSVSIRASLMSRPVDNPYMRLY